MYKKNWIPAFGIEFHLELDGLSLVMLMLTAFLGVLAIFASWREVTRKVQDFIILICFGHWPALWESLLLLTSSFSIVFWEIMLIPMYFLISIWGYSNREYAAYKFFIYTQLGGLANVTLNFGAVLYPGITKRNIYI